LSLSTDLLAKPKTIQRGSSAMKKIAICSIIAFTLLFSNFSFGQDLVRGLLGSQEGNTNKGTPPTNQSGGLIQGAIRDQIQNAIQPNPSNAQNTPLNSQRQGNAQSSGQGGAPIQSGVQFGSNAHSLLQSNQNLRVIRNGQIITIQQSTPQSNPNANPFGMSLGTRNNSVFISSLVSNGIASKAGLRAGDQIVSINGNPVSRPEDISNYMVQANNLPMVMVYVRNGQTGEAAFGAPNQADSSRSSPQSIQSKLDQIERLIGEIRAELSSSR
jgi:membrane-associated protease RseP (regulator of RpoE activity)